MTKRLTKKDFERLFNDAYKTVGGWEVRSEEELKYLLWYLLLESNFSYSRDSCFVSVFH